MSQVKSFLLAGIFGLSKTELGSIATAFVSEDRVKKLGKNKTKDSLFDLISKLPLSTIKEISMQNASKIAVHPCELCDYLGITKTERLRWQGNKLPIQYMDTWSFKYGNVPMFERIGISKITKATIEKWRNNDQKTKNKLRKEGAKKASLTRQRNEDIKTVSASYYKTMIDEWVSVSIEAKAIMDLAYWTVYCSRWAKYYEEKAWGASSKSLAQRYYDKKDEFYEIKNDAIEFFFENSMYCKFSKYIPCDPHKVEYRKVLSAEALRLQDMGEDPWNELSFDDRWDYKEVTKKHHYSLYFTSVSIDGLQESFAFHTPYPIGKNFLPPLDTLPDSPNHDSSEFNQGMHRFGRSINKDEMISHSESKTIQEIKRAFDFAKECFQLKQEPQLILN